MPARRGADVRHERRAQLDTPLILFLGRHHANVDSVPAAEWFDTVQVPQKALVWFDHSAHELMDEETGKTLASLVAHALPMRRDAERAGDAPERRAAR